MGDRVQAFVAAVGLFLLAAGCGSSDGPTPAAPTVPGAISLECAAGGADCAGVNQGDVVTFTARAAGGTSNLRGASLEFGDGAAQALDLTAAPIKIPHEYTRAGTFTARLAATDGGGTVLSSSQVVRVGPVVSASVNAVGTGGLSILATADVQGAPVALYEWFFDGPLATTSTTLNQVRFTYESRGHKDFWVRITLGDGRTVRASSAIVLE